MMASRRCDKAMRHVPFTLRYVVKNMLYSPVLPHFANPGINFYPNGSVVGVDETRSKEFRYTVRRHFVVFWDEIKAFATSRLNSIMTIRPDVVQ